MKEGVDPQLRDSDSWIIGMEYLVGLENDRFNDHFINSCR